MGIKDLDHLKKSLSKIESKSSELKITLPKIARLNQKIKSFAQSIESTRTRLEGLKEIVADRRYRSTKYEREQEKSIALSKEETAELSRILNEIKEIAKKTRDSGKQFSRPNNWGMPLHRFLVGFRARDDEYFKKARLLTIGKPEPARGGKYSLDSDLVTGKDYVFSENFVYILLGQLITFPVLMIVVGIKQGVIMGPEWSVPLGLLLLWCPIMPILLIFLTYLYGEKKIEATLVDGATIDRINELTKQKEPYEKRKRRYSGLQRKRQKEVKAEKDLEHKLNQNEAKIERLTKDLVDAKQKNKLLENEIEETFQSIKHLIPYSDYLTKV
jgi:peptidoglycan hydrolase CwlO-like protein